MITRKDLSLVGGKGANLGEMVKAGLPVPDDVTALQNASKTISDLFEQCPTPEEITPQPEPD